MKSFKILSAAALFAVAAFTVRGAANYDLVLGFDSSNSTETTNFLIDIGQVADYAAPGTYNLGNYSSSLTSLYGSDWYSANQVKWAAFGETKNTQGGSLYITSQWTSTTGTLGVDNSADYSATLKGSTVNGALGKVSQVYSSGVAGTSAEIGTLEIAKSSQNSFTTNAPFAMTATLVNNTLNSDTINGASFSASDLYLVTNNGTASAVSYSLLGTFAVYGNGDITFTVIPEPSTYAVILGALTIGFVALRRRFAKAV
jgi:hypothetical protein